VPVAALPELLLLELLLQAAATTANAIVTTTIRTEPLMRFSLPSRMRAYPAPAPLKHKTDLYLHIRGYPACRLSNAAGLMTGSSVEGPGADRRYRTPTGRSRGLRR
jgi:hypothetical protein